LSTVNIGAQAIANVNDVKQICGLGLSKTGSALTLGGSVNLAGTGCGLMSDSQVNLNSAPTVTGSNWAVYGTSGCGPGACPDPGMPYNYYSPPAANPLSKLDSESFNSSTTNGNNPACKGGSCCLSGCAKPPIVANTPSTLYTGLTVTTGDTVSFADNGTYFFYNAAIKINGGTVTGTGVTLVLLGDSSLTISGGTVTLSAATSNSTYPDLSGVLIDDQAPNKSSNAVKVNGGGTVALGGAMYFPNVDVTWNGTSANTNDTCSEVIANTLTMSGSAYMSTSGCTAGTVPYTQVVTLVQ
jgi:hypothetical protein